MTSGFGSKDVFDSNRRYYDEVAADYLKNEAYAYTPEIINDVRRLLSLAAKSAGEQSLFLDLGCGSGFLSKIVAEKGLFEKGVGVDASSKQVALYNENLAGYNFHATEGDAAQLIFTNETVDMVGGYSVLHHFYDYLSVLAECYRVLKIGGCMYFDFEPHNNFKRAMSLPIKIRRLVFDRSPSTYGSLEEVAEYHNNFTDGIDMNAIRRRFAGVLEFNHFGYRFPGTISGNVLKGLSLISNRFSPLFYFIARKVS